MQRTIDKLYFSQLALSTYLTCQLKFRRRYLEELYWPRPATEAVEFGTDFHAAAARYYLTGEPASYPGKMGEMLNRLYAFRPWEENALFIPEQQLRLGSDIYLLAKYDLVVLADQVFIYDWKTDVKKLKETFYRNAMQTLVYRYLMVAAGNGYFNRRAIKPGDVVMCYWNPNYPNEPLYFPYDEKQYQKDGTIIRGLISEIKAKPFHEFFTAGDKKVCGFCEYSPLCHGKPQEDNEDFDPNDLALSWDDIEESF